MKKAMVISNSRRLWRSFAMILVLAACGQGEQSVQEDTPHSLSTMTQSVTAAPSPTITSSPTLTLTPTITKTATITPTATITLTATLLSGKAPKLAPIYADLIFNGSRDKPNVALTFDVGETPKQPAGFDEGILQALVDNDAKATYFLGGVWMRNHPDETRRLAGNPLIELGNHSWSHTDFPTLIEADMVVEILWANDMLYQLTGKTTQLFRFPSGAYNDLSLSVVLSLGMYPIQWDVVTADPVPDNYADNIVKRVMERVQNGSIIVMHANGRGWHTAEALPEMIRRLREEGYVLVTISEMLDLEIVD